MHRWLSGVLCAAALLQGGCGGNAVDVAGLYEGSCSGTLTVLGFIAAPVDGAVSFSLQPSGSVFTAAGTLSVKRKSDGVVTYQANVAGQVEDGRAALTFTALDGRSTGTMSGDFVAGCWPSGLWTLSGLGATGSGTWQACRR